MITGLVTPIPEHADAYALGIIRLMKKSAEVNLPVVYGKEKRDLNQYEKSQWVVLQQKVKKLATTAHVHKCKKSQETYILE